MNQKNLKKFNNKVIYMMKYCEHVNCTYRLCKHHPANKKENEDYEIADLVHSKVCRLKTKPVKSNRDIEYFKSKRGSANNVE